MRAILTYHSIDPSGSPLSIPPEVFARQMSWLARSGPPVVAIEELLRLPEHGDAVALTFDDGFDNFATDAWPWLRDLGLPAVLYAVTDLVGGRNTWGQASGMPSLPLLDWNALGRLAEAGLQIGSHTRSHSRLPELDTALLEDELVGSSDRIGKEIGVRPRTFAYPYGLLDARVADRVRALYHSSCTTELRCLGRADRQHALPRIDTYYLRRAGQLEAWGTTRFRLRLRLRAGARRLRRGEWRHA